MRRTFTKLFIAAIAMSFAMSVAAQDCVYYTDMTYWEASDWYKVIDFKASECTDASVYPMTGAEDGKSDNLNYGQSTTKAPLGSGVIATPLYTTTDGVSYTPSGCTWPIKYHNCVFAPTHNTSAYCKLIDWGMNPSGSSPCYVNDNTVYTSKVYDMVGFVELNRDAAVEGGFGYMQIDDLYKVDKIQWAFSSTSWKRGVKMDISYESDSEGAKIWEPLRWLPSDCLSGPYTAFSEQGYELEETFDVEDDAPFSIRIRIWDGDTVSFKPRTYYEEIGDSVTLDKHFYQVPNDTTGCYQVARIHSFTVYAGVDGATYCTSSPIFEDGNNLILRKFDQEIRASKECSKIEVFDLGGKPVLKGQGSDLNIGSLNFGQYYIVRAMAKDGSVKSLKFMR